MGPINRLDGHVAVPFRPVCWLLVIWAVLLEDQFSASPTHQEFPITRIPPDDQLPVRRCTAYVGKVPLAAQVSHNRYSSSQKNGDQKPPWSPLISEGYSAASALMAPSANWESFLSAAFSSSRFC